MPETLTLAHSGDPDDVFMWWPLTGKVAPGGQRLPGPPRIRSGRFEFRAIPGDLAVFNHLAIAGRGHDITALSVRAYAQVADQYVLASCGSSFGEGYGPKVVAPREGVVREVGDLGKPGVRLAIPGRTTSAFLALMLLLGEVGARASPEKIMEVPFDQVIPCVRDGGADAGLVIHEGQIQYHAAGLVQVVDLGAWWQETRGLPLPLGVNCVRRDLDERLGKGTVVEVARLLRESLAYAIAHREESIENTMPYARENARRAGLPDPSRGEVERYLAMYVTAMTRDMGEVGRRAIERFLGEGASAGLCACPAVEVV
jgi:1,4-dihydroxy-6-naphthoate synthase